VCLNLNGRATVAQKLRHWETEHMPESRAEHLPIVESGLGRSAGAIEARGTSPKVITDLPDSLHLEELTHLGM
jgi:hypothetical protein